jgi:hypothetical protein
MGGLGILVILVAYVAAAVWLAMRARTWWRRVLVGAVAVLLPTTDAAIGRMVVRHLCGKDGGLAVYRVERNVEGVLGLAPNRATLERMGFRFIELDRGKADPGRAIRRIERMSDGEIVESFDSKPRAGFKVEQVLAGKTLLTTGYGTRDLQVSRMADGEVLARFRNYSGGTGWAESFLAQFTDAGVPTGTDCGTPATPVGPEEIVKLALKP